MAITRKPKREMSDEAFERIAGGAIDGTTKKRERGKGYAMGHKRQITHMITPVLLDQVDAEAERCGEARATVINRFIREGLERKKVT
ncbi:MULTISPECIES: hypothetical protein [Methylobacterium]|jgi:hypothetical protein|uniref:CopG family transcriptional regulator n=1 Tax=Methylobacterium jeotgali TaxID=381630 RepID=A0ABQ4SY71_9HYPH|nr:MULTISPECIES: hypothetical protein [Methylobacterium]PIU05672.1 MAG: CopG family transcriptional regulator [Methylobacterium sp. CG09_land_8_20_14_0_10_71_15]PIU12382.1 MAG: CopG family transcriptional regulator [Methylobacterium sp. CG08_land_8_20_14_0_20_71_15]GBU16894.1 hypothetical protein AwMethylo_11090 [Methylobacterium sp.]GJE06848.1 hypothetical protein AOPFMNJM_2170 [Methylobacterium jeotgali]